MATPGDHTLAAELATRAGELLLDIRDRLTVDGAPSAVMRHEGDQRSHEYLMAALAEHRPTDAVLSEEGTAHVVHPDRTGADRIWIVDPVDGTREYSEPPRSDWAVHVALVEEGRPTAGAVALPALGLTLSTVGPPHGSDLPPIGDRPRMVVSRSRPPAEALAVCLGDAGHHVAVKAAVLGVPVVPHARVLGNEPRTILARAVTRRIVADDDLRPGISFDVRKKRVQRVLKRLDPVVGHHAHGEK